MTKSQGVDTFAPKVTERLWSPNDVSDFLGVPVATLQRWRYLRQGPPTFKVGRHVRYAPEDVRQWLLRQRQDGGP